MKKIIRLLLILFSLSVDLEEVRFVDKDGRDFGFSYHIDGPFGFFQGVDGRFSEISVEMSAEMLFRVIDIDGNEIIPFGRYAGIYLVVGGAAVRCLDTELWGIIRFN